MAKTFTLLQNRADAFVEGRRIQYAITGLILLNAVTLGLATVPTITGPFGAVLHTIDAVIITCFVVELALRLFAQGWRFFLSGWNI
ncbi:MAG: ion transporter, partial [Alphaproteobacteria bacterium]